jgi:general stress protein 26
MEVKRSGQDASGGTPASRRRLLQQFNNSHPEQMMADLKMAEHDTEKQLFDEIDDIHAGMLGVSGSGLHMQPMAPQLDREARTIWFFTRKDAELVKAVADAGAGAHAHFCVVGKNHDYHACLAGPIREGLDAAKRDEYWNSVVEAWFDGGKDDPMLTMLALRLDDAKIWASTDSKLKFGWEIAKANLTDEDPHVGVTKHLRF